jgi:hypothetical protein
MMQLVLPLLLLEPEQQGLLNLERENTSSYQEDHALRTEPRRLRSMGLVKRHAGRNIGDRSVTWNPDETAPGRSVVLGGIAGFVVGAAYLIPQFIGAPDVLASKPTEVVWKAKVQFVSAVLVAISAGVGFDTVFARLRKDAEQQPIGVSVSSQVQKWKW